jgi:hypothetical protein
MSPDGSRRGLQAGDPLIEVALLLEVSGRPGCSPVRLQRGGTVVSHLQEVAADGLFQFSARPHGLGGGRIRERHRQNSTVA